MIATSSDVSTFVTEKVAEIWPTLNIRADFHPILNLTFGDIGSDVLLKISAITRETPEDMGARLMPHLTIEGAFSIDRGFLNYRNDAPHWFLTPETHKPLPPHMRFAALGFRKGETVLSSLRVLSGLFLQAFEAERLGVDVALIAPTGELLPFHSTSAPMLFQKLFSACSDYFDVSPKLLELLLSGESHSVVWFSHNQLPDALRKRLLLSDARSKERLLIRIPERFWTAGKVVDVRRDWIENTARDLNGLLSLLYYLSGDLLYDEIDPSTVSSREYANTWWFMHAMVERIKLHTPPFETPHGLVSASKEERALLHRIKFLDLFRARAVMEGMVVEYVMALRDLCERFNMFFNHPSFRSRMKTSEVSATEYQIISGTSKALGVLLKV